MKRGIQRNAIIVHGRLKLPKANKVGRSKTGNTTSQGSCFAPPAHGIRILSLSTRRMWLQSWLPLLRQQQRLERGVNGIIKKLFKTLYKLKIDKNRNKKNVLTCQQPCQDPHNCNSKLVYDLFLHLYQYIRNSTKGLTVL